MGEDRSAVGEGIVTILTPTFNRAKYLPTLYASLTSQTDRRFNWLVVDDGSVDDTEETVRGFAGDIAIRYIKKENGGKHTAVNTGMELVTTPLVMLVDSDDTLTEDAVETVIGYYESYKARKGELKLCGFSFLRSDSAGEINGGPYPEDEAVGSLVEKRINAGIWGDRAEVYYTDVLKKFPFPVFGKEKFFPEDGVWVRMSGPYALVHINRVIYICDYLKGGLTDTGRKMKIYSPLGMMYRSASYINDAGVGLKTRIRMLLLYRIYERFAGESEIPDDCRIKKGALYALCGPPSFLFYLRWRK